MLVEQSERLERSDGGSDAASLAAIESSSCLMQGDRACLDLDDYDRRAVGSVGQEVDLASADSQIPGQDRVPGTTIVTLGAAFATLSQLLVACSHPGLFSPHVFGCPTPRGYL